MLVKIKTPEELTLMRESGRLLAQVFAMLDDYVKAGISTMDINNRVEEFIVNDLQARPASKGQYDFPYVLNPSVNHVVCHGMPKASQLLRNGDIINNHLGVPRCFGSAFLH